MRALVQLARNRAPWLAVCLLTGGLIAPLALASTVGLGTDGLATDGAPSITGTATPADLFEFELEVDCDRALTGVQTDCEITPGTTSLTVDIVATNNSHGDHTIAAFQFALLANQLMLDPPSVADETGLNANPDFNEIDLMPSGEGWNCNLIPPQHDRQSDGGGHPSPGADPAIAESTLACFHWRSSVHFPARTELTLATISYSVADAGTSSLEFREALLSDRDGIELLNCPSDGTPDLGGRCTISTVSMIATHGSATPLPTGCFGDADCDGFMDVEAMSHQGPTNSNYGVDNCLSIANRDQVNSDGDFVDFPVKKLFDDTTVPNSDALGDACDDDDDNDGIKDADEFSGDACGGIITDPLKADTDGDNYLDGAECAIGTNPTDINSRPATAQCVALAGTAIGTDTDGDKILDWREVCFYNTNPNDPNTDGDACDDGKENASINGDLTVNIVDLQQIASEIGTYTLPGSPVKVNFDITKDGGINIVDLQQAAQQLGAC